MLPRCDYLRSGGVILKTLERWPVELRVANDLSRRIDERDAVPGRDAGLIGQGIRKSSGFPLRRQQPRLTARSFFAWSVMLEWIWLSMMTTTATTITVTIASD